MYLKRLEVSGFKSFARHTILEFPTQVTAIVGPNGSGKSNIKEAIQWVLGEQSVKSLRGKKGEDLIWNGSSLVPRLGRASVTLRFDNSTGDLPVDFEEVALGRKIFRDGINEYHLNDSQVRLKDIADLTARMGLGDTKHTIIGQGEVDRLLLSTPKERREMLEEALGLRVYQLKKHEAERKFAATQINMAEVASLLREIAPHLKFLRNQAEKANMRGTLENQLNELERLYFACERHTLSEEARRLDEDISPFTMRSIALSTAIANIKAEIDKTEWMLSSVVPRSDDEKKLSLEETRRRELEREIGRLEGRLEAERSRLNQPKIRAVDLRFIKTEVEEVLHEFRNILQEEDELDLAREQLLVLVEDLEALLEKIERGSTQEIREESEWAIVRSLAVAIKSLQEELERIHAGIERIHASLADDRERGRSIQQKIRALESTMRAKEEERRELSIAMQRLTIAREQLNVKRRVFEEELHQSSISQEELESVPHDRIRSVSSHDIRRSIDRLKGKLEEIGGIDPAAMKEYRDTEARHSFLTKELSDLEHAFSSLREVIKELEAHLKEDFKRGFAKIREEFQTYFHLIFGGGKADLELAMIPTVGEEEGDGQDPGAAVEAGIELIVDLPKKRIHGLQMLSGGERALTSIALLFALAAVHPPPFLILDETDAALDEANSERFGHLVGELSKKTQLLLITHNRETMKSAGLLYGVTMGDDGVSKLLSLKLGDAERYTNR